MRYICSKCDDPLIVTKELVNGEEFTVVDICKRCERELKDKISYWYYISQTRKERNK